MQTVGNKEKMTHRRGENITMKRRFTVIAAMGITAALLAGCGSKGQDGAANESGSAQGTAQESTVAAGGSEAEASDDREEMTYMSSDGFQVRYNAGSVESMEVDEHTVQFVYTGESAGSNLVKISYIADKQPEEVLYDLTSTWGDQESIYRSEGFLPGTDDKWGYWRMLNVESGEAAMSENAIAGEYNGGVILFESLFHMSGNDEIDMPVSDVLSGIVDSITYDSFAPQTMYSYYPGAYAAEGGTLTLSDDHSGVLSIQDDVDVLWGSNYIMAADGGFKYEFVIEGDTLYLDYDGSQMEFTKQ